MIKWLKCLLAGHTDVDYMTTWIYPNTGYHEVGHKVVYSWRCVICGRIREYQR
jgi:hypothetical protein